MDHWPNRIREIRLARGLSQAELARHLNVSAAHINRFERGHRRFSAEWANRIARVLEVEPGLLMAAAEPAVAVPLGGEAAAATDVEAAKLTVGGAVISVSGRLGAVRRRKPRLVESKSDPGEPLHDGTGQGSAHPIGSGPAGFTIASARFADGLEISILSNRPVDDDVRTRLAAFLQLNKI